MEKISKIVIEIRLPNLFPSPTKLRNVDLETIPKDSVTKRLQDFTVSFIRRSPRIVPGSEFLKPGRHNYTGKLRFSVIGYGRTGFGCLANPYFGLKSIICQN